MPNGEKSLVRDGAARNHSCWTRGDCETSLHAVGHGTARNCCCDARRRETIAAGTWRGEITAVVRRTAETTAAGREVEKPIVAGRRTERNHLCWWGGEKLLLLDAGLREITAAGRGMARYDCCWMPNVDKSLLLDEGRRETNTAAGRVTARNQYCCGVGQLARNHC